MFVSLSNRLKIWPGNRCITFPENNSEEATANNDLFLRGDKKGRDQTTRHTALNNKKRSGCVRLQMFGAHNGHDDTLHARLCAVTTQNSVHVIKRHETTGHLFGKSLSSLVPSGRVCVCVCLATPHHDMPHLSHISPQECVRVFSPTFTLRGGCWMTVREPSLWQEGQQCENPSTGGENPNSRLHTVQNYADKSSKCSTTREIFFFTGQIIFNKISHGAFEYLCDLHAAQ